MGILRRAVRSAAAALGAGLLVVGASACRDDGGIAVRSVEAVPPSLEDVFVALVRGEGGAPEG